MSINPFKNLTDTSNIRISFKDLDTNNDGKISKNEFREIGRKFNIRFEDIDKNDDFEIDDDEFSKFEEILEDSGAAYTNTTEPDIGDLLAEMEPELRSKAEKMCERNGIEFNEDVYRTIFDNTLASAYDYKNIADSDKILKDLTNSFNEAYTSWVKTEKN